MTPTHHPHPAPPLSPWQEEEWALNESWTFSEKFLGVHVGLNVRGDRAPKLSFAKIFPITMAHIH